MSTAAFWLVAVLVGWKATHEIQVKPPYEWTGELSAGFFAFAVAGIAALPLYLIGA